MTKSFAGRYVNFGVFELYGDKALEIVLNTSFEMMLCVPFDDILVRNEIYILASIRKLVFFVLTLYHLDVPKTFQNVLRLVRYIH